MRLHTILALLMLLSFMGTTIKVFKKRSPQTQLQPVLSKTDVQPDPVINIPTQNPQTTVISSINEGHSAGVTSPVATNPITVDANVEQAKAHVAQAKSKVAQTQSKSQQSKSVESTIKESKKESHAASKQQQAPAKTQQSIVLRAEGNYYTTQMMLQKYKHQVAIDTKFPSWMFVDKGKICQNKNCMIHNSINCQKAYCHSSKDHPKDVPGRLESHGKIGLAYQLQDTKSNAVELYGDFLQVARIKASKRYPLKDSKKTVVGAINPKDWPKVTLSAQKGIDIHLCLDFLHGKSKPEGKAAIGTSQSQPDSGKEEEVRHTYISVHNKRDTATLTDIAFAFKNAGVLFNIDESHGNFMTQHIKDKMFPSDCKYQEGSILCESEAQLKNTVVEICLSSVNGCLKLNGKDLLKKISEKRYQLMYSVDADKDSLQLYPAILSFFTVSLEQGKVKEINKNSNYKIEQIVEKSDDQDQSESKSSPIKKQNIEEDQSKTDSQSKQQQSEKQPFAKPSKKSSKPSHQKAEDQDSSEQESKKSSKASKHKDEDSQEEDSQEQQIAPKHKKTKAENGYSFSSMMWFVYYGIFALGVIIVIKWKASESMVAYALDSVLNRISDFVNRRKGYQPSNFNEEIDDNNSVAVGYSEEKGKRMYWEKNSVEGI